MCNKNGILNLLKSAAKLRRFSANSKKSPQFFLNLFGQTPHFWTNRVNPLKNCPKGTKNGPPLRAKIMLTFLI